MSATSPESGPPAGGSAPLAEPEGVNAGSADELREPERSGDDVSPVRAGGDPAGAPATAMQIDEDPSDEEGDELVGTTEQDGQDAGSMG